MYVCLLWFWGPGLRMLCVRSMRNTEARPDCSQPAIQAFTVQTYTHTPPFPIPGPPKTKTETAKTLAENVSEVECTGRQLAQPGWLVLIYIYICVCVCLCGHICGAQ
jgi:hypothetical protein